jgi:hypothetical protein
MIIGITGTREGMNVFQRGQLILTLTRWFYRGWTEFHHGMCVGVDEESHEIVRRYWPEIRIVGHPPQNQSLMTKKPLTYERLARPRPYLVRNKDIVDASRLLVVVPKENNEIVRSGTWSTYRYAKKKGLEVVLIRPGGLAQE